MEVAAMMLASHASPIAVDDDCFEEKKHGAVPNSSQNNGQKLQ